MIRRSVLAALFLLGLGLPSFGQRKACESLKTEIAAKLDAKGVKNYTLTIVVVSEVKDGDRVVGSCDAGSKRIVYVRE
jgi:hypothetical protein